MISTDDAFMQACLGTRLAPNHRRCNSNANPSKSSFRVHLGRKAQWEEGSGETVPCPQTSRRLSHAIHGPYRASHTSPIYLTTRAVLLESLLNHGLISYCKGSTARVPPLLCVSNIIDLLDTEPHRSYRMWSLYLIRCRSQGTPVLLLNPLYLCRFPIIYV